MQDQGWAGIGERIRAARTASRHTQDELATALNIDRSSVVRIEAGHRKVSALELAALADLLDVPMEYFLRAGAPAVTSRRQALSDDPDEATRAVWRLDIDLQTHAANVAWLADHDLLTTPELRLAPGTPTPTNRSDAEKLAIEVRDRLGLSAGPLPSLAAVCERWGLYPLVVDRDADGATMLVDTPADLGAAVIGGQADPGRRRTTAAHELGHHLFGDAYSSDVGVSIDRNEREQVIDSFAWALLLPEADFRQAWQRCHERTSDLWRTLVWIAGRYRVSWGVVVQRARGADLISGETARTYAARRPVRGDFLAELGTAPEEDLTIGSAGPKWTRAVLAAYQDALITGRRAMELLPGAVRRPEDLPSRAEDVTA